MPYIEKQYRPEIDASVDELMDTLFSFPISGTCEPPSFKGKLNYTITRLIHKCLKNRGVCYDNLSDIIGVLEDVKTEFNRTIVGPYENKKISENGRIGVLDIEGC